MENSSNINIEKKIETLIEWIKKHGGFIHPELYIETTTIGETSYRSVYCKNQNRVSQKSLLTQIPEKLCISKKSFKNIPHIDKWKSLIEKNENTHLKHRFKSARFHLMMALMYEISKEKESFFYPYIDTLLETNSFDNHPYYLYYKNSHAFDAIEQTSKDFIMRVSTKASELKEYIQMIHLCNTSHTIFDEKKFNKEQLTQLIIWSFFIEITRTWKYGLVPFNDMFNHDNRSRIFLNATSKEHYTFKADKQFDKSDNEAYEVFINYAHYASYSMLTTYNFLPDNTIDYLIIPIDFKAHSNLDKVKIQEIKSTITSNRKVLLSSLGPSKDLFKILRILSLSKEEYLLNKNKKNRYNTIINQKNELRSMQLLVKILGNLKESKYHQKSFEIHTNLLKDLQEKELSLEEVVIQNVCQLRLKEHAIVSSFLQKLNQKLNSFNLKERH